MGRIGDMGWAIRDRLSGTAVALVLALAGIGAGVAGIVIALDAKDKAEEAQSAATAPVSVPSPVTPTEDNAKVDELHDRVAAIEESVAELRAEAGEATPSEAIPPEDTTTTPEEPTVPETPELPEGIEIPGADSPEPPSPAQP